MRPAQGVTVAVVCQHTRKKERGGRSDAPMDYWLVTTGPDDKSGINGAIMPRRMSDQVTTNTIAAEITSV